MKKTSYSICVMRVLLNAVHLACKSCPRRTTLYLMRHVKRLEHCREQHMSSGNTGLKNI